jgi:aspartyl-tRNA(Asn)/glutamyl-tRNA(Gln) amidotransferase subunit A
MPVDDYLGRIEDGVRDLRIGVVSGRFLTRFEAEERPAPAVAAAVDAAAALLSREGAHVEDAELPRSDELRAAQLIVIGTEAGAFHRDRIATDRARYGADVARRIDIGLARTGPEYALARRTKDELRRAYASALGEWDAVLLPTTPMTAPVREGADAVAAAARLTAYTSPFNLVGLPAISIPCGADASGLPIGLQLVARPWAEARLLRIARAFERATAWSGRRPS